MKCSWEIVVQIAFFSLSWATCPELEKLLIQTNRIHFKIDLGLGKYIIYDFEWSKSYLLLESIVMGELPKLLIYLQKNIQNYRIETLI